MFDELLAAYLAQPAVVPTSGDDAAALLRFFFEHPSETRFDGGRNVDYVRCSAGARFETAARIEETARTLAEQLPRLLARPARREVRIGEAVRFDRLYELDTPDRTYFAVPVESRIGDGLALREEFLLYHDEATARWTIVRRLTSAIDEVKVKGLGTFAFDSSDGWRLTKAVAPAWSERKAALHVDGGEEALTPGRIGFVREIVGNDGFRAAFEAHVFTLYVERLRPEFEAMPEDEKEEWVEAYPALTAPRGIWALFGKRATLHVEDDTTFSFHVDAGFDPEHGLTVRVRAWKIDPRTS